MPTRLKRGNRACLACSRAYTYVITARGQGVDLDLQAEADRYFTLIALYGADEAKRLVNHHRARTHCPRGHALAEPNLVPSALRAGKRQCLACSRGVGNVWVAAERGETLDPDVESDRHYAAIMAGTWSPQRATHCKRGHPLMEPNLSARGECLACNRARSTVHYAAKNGVVMDMQAEADRHYALLVAA